jgi:hypothetical protein
MVKLTTNIEIGLIALKKPGRKNRTGFTIRNYILQELISNGNSFLLDIVTTFHYNKVDSFVI